MGENTIKTELRTVDGRPLLHFRRVVAAPIDRVWRAVSDRDEIRTWFVPVGPWSRVNELGTLLGDIEGEAAADESRREISWTHEGDRYDFHLVEQGTGTLLELSVPVDEPEDAPLDADTVDQFLDRLAPYLAGDDLTWDAMADLDAMERRIDSYAERFGVDPTRGLEAVARSRTAVEESAEAEPWHFEPSQEAADALEERMTAYLREHNDAFEAANARRGDEGQEALMTALDEWILPSARSVEEIGDRHFFVLDRFIRDESIAVPDLESAWPSTASGDQSSP